MEIHMNVIKTSTVSQDLHKDSGEEVPSFQSPNPYNHLH